MKMVNDLLQEFVDLGAESNAHWGFTKTSYLFLDNWECRRMFGIATGLDWGSLFLRQESVQREQGTSSKK